MSRARKLALWPLTMIACWPAAALRAGPTESDGTPAAVRSTDRALNELVAEGYARSPTFRRLVDGISVTKTLVYVQAGSCAYGHLNGCLAAFIAATGQGRYLRIIVTRPSLLDRNRLIALVAHELQHALEVAEHSEVVDVDGMIELFRRIGFPLKDRFGYRQGYETAAARAAGEAVFDELTVSQTPEAPCARDGFETSPIIRAATTVRVVSRWGVGRLYIRSRICRSSRADTTKFRPTVFSRPVNSDLHSARKRF